MTKQQKIFLLNEWVAEYNKLSAIYDRANELMGCHIEAPLFNAIWQSFDKYTDCLGQLVGDDGTWLAWYCFENEMGKKGYEAGKGKRKNRPIKTIEDLVWIIELK